jgi:acyl-CoA synthetase (AMP-forming)/AMP-acid ligase II
MNILEPILFQCKLNPLALAICVPGSKLESVTYGMLEQFIYNASRTAIKSGIAPGNVVATYINDTVLHTSLVLGLMHVGAVGLSLRGQQPVAGIVPDFILTDVPGRISGGAAVLNVDRSWLEGNGAAEQRMLHSRNYDDICRIISTSGSTGVSKGIAFSHKMLATRVLNHAYSRGPRNAHCSRFFCDLGIATAPGFLYAIALLTRGGTIYFLGPDPVDILQMLDLHKIQGMATSPYGLGEFLKYFESDSAFDLNFDHIVCQGAMLSQELSQRARARMCQNLYSSYGSTEAGVAAFGPASVLEKVPGAVGYILPDVTVEAVDRSGKVMPPMHDGELRAYTDQMARGYIGDPDSTQRFFRDGFFYTGDIGHITPDGLLVITGREKTALSVGGDTVSPELVEGVITSFPGVREAGVFTVDNQLGIAELSALIVTGSPIDDATLHRHCAGSLPSSSIPVRFIVVDALPRGGQGKLERHRLPELAAAKTKAI